MRFIGIFYLDPTQIVNILLDKGAEVDSQALDGSTSLHQAASQGLF